MTGRASPAPVTVSLLGCESALLMAVLLVGSYLFEGNAGFHGFRLTACTITAVRQACCQK